MADLSGAKILLERGQIHEAIAVLDELLNRDFTDHEVQFYYGTALFQLGKFGLAATALKQAIQTRPTFQSAYQNLGNCFKAALDNKAAEEVYRLGLKLGDDSQLFCCMGSVNINYGSPAEALMWYERGLKMDPNNDVIRFNMGLAYLELGKWEKGFAFYEKGFAGGNRPARQYSNLPLWDGSPDHTVIIWGEQGLGDEVMFMSLIPDAIKNCKRVILDCHPRLVKTMERSFGVECHGTRKNHHLEWLPESDATAHICVTSLANLYRHQDSDFPGTPYLKADAEKIAGHRKHADGRLRVGISWEGGTPYTRNDLRSMPIESLKPILDLDCDFYSLQYTQNAARDVCSFEEKTGLRVKHYPRLVESYDYDETVNFIASLDLVITVCTTAFHVAGALGVPVWCMTPSKPAWRYRVSGDSSPWYQSAELIRQKPGESWAPVIHRISERLNAHIKQLSGSAKKAA